MKKIIWVLFVTNQLSATPSLRSSLFSIIPFHPNQTQNNWPKLFKTSRFYIRSGPNSFTKSTPNHPNFSNHPTSSTTRHGLWVLGSSKLLAIILKNSPTRNGSCQLFKFPSDNTYVSMTWSLCLGDKCCKKRSMSLETTAMRASRGSRFRLSRNKAGISCSYFTNNVK
jgi:hypothetical protein